MNLEEKDRKLMEMAAEGKLIYPSLRKEFNLLDYIVEKLIKAFDFVFKKN